jgi:hypothetical protein
MVGFSADGSLVHLAEADELRTHAWPGLKELTSVQFDDDFVSSYSGALIGARILVDGQDSETKEDAVTSFDLTATKGAFPESWLKSGVPQVGQNFRLTVLPLSPFTSKLRTSPWRMRSAAGGTRATVANGPPDAYWQSRQWQWPVKTGSPVHS